MTQTSSADAKGHQSTKEMDKIEAGIGNPANDDVAKGKVQDIILDTINAADGQYTKADYKRADKTSISTQATFGMREDTGLVGQQFSWLSTIFYIMYLVGEAPGNYLMQRFSLNKTLFICMFCWGVIVLCIGFTHNFAQLMALRALQGLFECTISPAFLLITASFYVSREHTMRSIIWGTSNSGMDILTQLVMYGIGKAAKASPSSFGPWRYISIFLGSWTIIMSFCSLLVLGTPNEVRWLSKEEKRIAAARVTYFFFFTVIVNSLPNGGTTAFGNLVYVSFGFTNLETLVKGTIPQNIVTIAWFLFVGFLTLKKPNLRFILMVVSTIPAFVGMLALGLLPKDGMLWTRWGLYLMTVTGRLPGLLIWTLLPSNVAGRTKKSVTGAVMFIAYCIGNAIGAQTFQAKWAPRYVPSMIICGVMYALECVLFILWRFYYIVQNRRRAKLVEEMGLTPEESAHQGQINGEMDVTDWENIHFRYSMVKKKDNITAPSDVCTKSPKLSIGTIYHQGPHFTSTLGRSSRTEEISSSAPSLLQRF
ncbi:major facilitator superfamily domain-containing protein [Fusarium solani]|uniref:Major facilitator superfamily domain-containing protein n=1 Tax=Fusarium solani TaxID=169388 RepID=A0A9P9G8D1_FUSSL|nr:major facilitator superfamily domain-containing protein [Fusarium solani]KAH7234246.1 major facilitator superfamily domain-containing protein [Fusarium solani]